MQAEVQASSSGEPEASTSEQQTAGEVPRRSLGDSLSSAVKDVKEHLHMKSSTSTGGMPDI